MKKIKKLCMLGLSFAILGSAVPALADNSDDSPWSNVYQWNSPYDHTPARYKTNKTAYYNYVQKTTDIGYMNIWAALYDGRDVSDGHSYKVQKGDKTKLYNKAVEWYQPGISVRIDSSRYWNGKSSGVWSPDSI
ncbi:hypothetical protein RGU76_30315 [Bacillus pseudomycoides]|uniref:hypothetical protein n=1 Tax=Bacillus TaxID=1386 RepID=UPI002248DFD7|nr:MULTISPECIES: hypothetical protein [Bacillus]MCX2829657.1 hypothetical protein [Bacillus sp. DHT2]MDR4919089.1 hypothetical protein [Bacillus pseudomycoides]